MKNNLKKLKQAHSLSNPYTLFVSYSSIIIPTNYIFGRRAEQTEEWLAKDS